MYDVIVVGARCAGAPTALLLAGAGHRVLLADRATFPSDMRLSTHLVWPAGVARLARWGLHGALAATGCPPLTDAAVDLGPFALHGPMPVADGVGTAYVPRRRVLDALLVDAAVAAGAELAEGFSVEDLVWDGGAVAGVRGRSGGRPVRVRARIVIGADGTRSRIARLVRAREYATRPPVQGCYFSYWSGAPVATGTLYPRDGRTVYAFPTHDDLTLVGVNWRIERWREVRADVDGEHRRAVADAAPELAEQLAAGRREERWVGAATPGFLRTPFGPGWALVGDAGHTKDPCTAQGITEAWRQAELLAAAVHDGLGGRVPLPVALAGFHRQRDAGVMPIYEFTSQTARMEPPTPEEAALLASLQGDPVATARFFGVLAGTVDPAEFFGAAPAAA
ncbi:MAG TPA: FAD-dependent oxidoreductase [Pseudonocardia sp.]|nr:FAD-dependent oxidoreductase [Pseudonocardia sp.]